MKYPLIKNNILRQDLDEIIQHLKKDDPILTNGPKVREFEEAWNKWLGTKFSIFVNSGSSANLLSLTLLKIKYPDGGEVIVPPFTWVSDIASVIQCGFTPVFADIDLDTLAMNFNEIKKKVNSKTKAIFLSHIQGLNGISESLLELASSKNIELIEDVCESHGAKHKDIKVGNFGWTSNFSFYYAHHMSTIEGGMISTNNEETYENLRMLRSHGMVREMTNEKYKIKYLKNNNQLNEKFIFFYPAYNFRNTEIGAIMGLSQLKRLDDNIYNRNENFKYFLDKIDQNKYFKDFNLLGSSNYAFNLILNDKDKEYMDRLCSNLEKFGIEFRKGSAGGGNQLRQPYLSNYIKEKEYNDYEVTEHVHFYGMYLGNYPELQKDDIDYIVDKINI